MTKIVALDTEGTGLINAKIIELAVLITKLDSPNMLIGESSFINPQVPIELAAMAVHNITDEMVKSSPLIHASAAYGLLSTALKDSANIVLGYNLAFDLESYRLSTGTEIVNPKIDMYKVVYRHFEYDKEESLESYRLNYLRYRLNLNDEFIRKSKEVMDDSNRGPHSAMYDTLLVLLVFNYFKSIYSIEEMLNISAAPLILKRISFGKHKGKTFEEVAITDYDYLTWLRDSEVKKSTEKGMNEAEMKNNHLLGTILYFVEKYKP